MPWRTVPTGQRARRKSMTQTAILDGKMGACAMHLEKAMHAGMMK
jgi:hypothetical protein